MAVNYLLASAISTAASLAGLQWWLDGIESGGLLDGDDVHPGRSERVLELLLGSNVAMALLANFVLNLVLLVVLSLKTLFFVQLYPTDFAIKIATGPRLVSRSHFADRLIPILS